MRTIAVLTALILCSCTTPDKEKHNPVPEPNPKARSCPFMVYEKGTPHLNNLCIEEALVSFDDTETRGTERTALLSAYSAVLNDLMHAIASTYDETPRITVATTSAGIVRACGTDITWSVTQRGIAYTLTYSSLVEDNNNKLSSHLDAACGARNKQGPSRPLFFA